MEALLSHSAKVTCEPSVDVSDLVDAIAQRGYRASPLDADGVDGGEGGLVDVHAREARRLGWLFAMVSPPGRIP